MPDIIHDVATKYLLISLSRHYISEEAKASRAANNATFKLSKLDVGKYAPPTAMPPVQGPEHTSTTEDEPLPPCQFPATQRLQTSPMANAIAGPSSGPSDSHPASSGSIVSTTQTQGDQPVTKKPHEKGKKKA
ncbi:uncharacterized protein EI90DRAFT_3122183 [Cantharellus anzutake]|uniref:uncharacterized protein n=1 Tax=Cantharellus anzutake TaxID=1750568 RepID=UPI001907CE3E|nr:uncharacterized protein EI90DRAFT_3122183 [Cantharellus anzutake]KAF8333120.1 hypothetical protein EI90DRAFT_3122183 [Cantharellus anzutake]